jgi:hypothetical protein
VGIKNILLKKIKDVKLQILYGVAQIINVDQEKA